MIYAFSFSLYNLLKKKHVVKINKQCYILTCPGFDVVSLKNPSFTEKLSKEWCHIVPKKNKHLESVLIKNTETI